MRLQAQKLKVYLRRPILGLVSTVFVLLAVGGSLYISDRHADAATNSTINFQARLMNNSGSIVSDGYYNVEFKVYDVSSGGSALWTETYYDSNGVTAGNDNRVRVANGYLTVSLGSQTAFPGTINWDQQLWITMNIGGTTQTATPTWDGEMSPRLQLTAVPYAFRAGQLARQTGSNTAVLQLANSFGQSTTITLPDPGASTATVCYQNAVSCGFAAGSASSYIQNQNASPQSSSNFWISGVGRADTALQGPAIRPASNGTTAIQFQNAAGSSTAMSVDTTNNRVSIGNGGTAFAPQQALDVIGSVQVRDAATAAKSYRLRTSGADLDFESAGSKLYISNWTNADYTGTQRTYLVLENSANMVQAIGAWHFRTAADGTTRHLIDGSAGTSVIFNQNGEGTNFSVLGDTDTNLLFVQGSTDRVGIGTNTPAYKLDVAGTFGASGNVTIGGATLMQNTATNALSVKNATGSATALHVDTSNLYVGVGTAAPSRPLHVSANNALTNAPSLLVEQAGSGDASIEFKDASGRRFFAGIDRSGGSSFRIASSTSAGTPFTAGFGTLDNYAGSTSGEAGTAWATRVTTGSGQTGTLSSVTTYVVDIGASPGMQVALYSDNGSGTAPSTLIATSGAINLTGNSWNTLPISASVTQNTTYWLVIQVEGGSTELPTIGSTGSTRRHYTGVTYGVWNNPPSGSSTTSTNVSPIYMTGTFAGAVDTFGGVNLFTLTDSGATTFQNSTNSTNAFQIQNASGTNLLNVNTSTSTLTLGTSAGSSSGLVVINTPTFTTASTQSCGSNCTITQANVDGNGAVIVNATATGLTLTLPDPTLTTAGRIVYVTAANGSNDFTLAVNGGGTGNQIAMRQNTTATMIWNGSDWTAAGASSSTTLQSAYDSTLSSAGGAEIVLNNSATSDGLTIRNNASNPIMGAILETQTSIGSNLFSVNNNATEYASNGGAETAGASSSTFPSNTWSAAPGGGTITRNTTAANNATGQASVSVVTTATTGHGARDRLSAALTANLQYTVSFTVRGTSSFTTLDTVYSRDGTNTSTTACATGSTVTTAIWKRVTCTFTAPSSGITSSNEIFIRQSDATARTFYIDNLSVTVNASANHAADGSVDSALGTNWTAYDADGGAGTTNLTRDTSVIFDTSGSVADVTTAAANLGMRNNMVITPQVNTQYLVTFYARSTNTFNDIRVGFLPAGGSSTPVTAQLCTDYNTQSVSTTGWTKITCIITTPSSGITDPDLVIYQPTGTARTFYVDALSITLNTNTASNVQVGGGSKGGPATLFTLDRSSGAPIADNNEAYLGSMYYDTTSGRIQCYEADGWGACGAAPDNIVNLNPEYAGAVLNGTGVGTMSADFCSNDTALTINSTLCSTGQARNFYKWTSPQATLQTYSVYVTYQLPATFNGFSSDDTVQLVARADSTSDAAVTYEMFKSTGSAVTRCGTGETTVVTSANTWQTVGINGNEATGCSFSSSSAGNFIIFKINVKARNTASAYVSTLSFTTTGR
jgi:hypothetical protein